MKDVDFVIITGLSGAGKTHGKCLITGISPGCVVNPKKTLSTVSWGGQLREIWSKLAF